eukprot:scaffold319769_cov26-Tisochrysis_lutea.AAC.1
MGALSAARVGSSAMHRRRAEAGEQAGRPELTELRLATEHTHREAEEEAPLLVAAERSGEGGLSRRRGAGEEGRWGEPRDSPARHHTRHRVRKEALRAAPFYGGARGATRERRRLGLSFVVVSRVPVASSAWDERGTQPAHPARPARCAGDQPGHRLGTRAGGALFNAPRTADGRRSGHAHQHSEEVGGPKRICDCVEGGQRERQQR